MEFCLEQQPEDQPIEEGVEFFEIKKSGLVKSRTFFIELNLVIDRQVDDRDSCPHRIQFL